MIRRVLGTLLLSLLICAGARAQGVEGFLDVGILKVKSERRADFEALARKLAAANRRHNGDHWIMFETLYGEQNTFTYVSPRPDYASLEQAYGDFMSAMTKGLGEPAATKLMVDFGSCVSNSRGELRRRRWDLSINPPADPEEMFKRVGAARWNRVAIVRVRPGRVLQFEDQLRAVKEAAAKRKINLSNYVSQAVVGSEGTVFYVSWLTDSLGAFDSIPGLPQILGEEGFKNFQERSAENVETTTIAIARIVPELSNPPKPVVDAAPDFWNPKPAPAAKSKPKAKEDTAN